VIEIVVTGDIELQVNDLETPQGTIRRTTFVSKDTGIAISIPLPVAVAERAGRGMQGQGLVVAGGPLPDVDQPLSRQARRAAERRPS
jgi:hypothetical protein